MRGVSRRWIISEVENSLRRLDTDWIDLYQMHRPVADTDIDIDIDIEEPSARSPTSSSRARFVPSGLGAGEEWRPSQTKSRWRGMVTVL